MIAMKNRRQWASLQIAGAYGSTHQILYTHHPDIIFVRIRKVVANYNIRHSAFDSKRCIIRSKGAMEREALDLYIPYLTLKKIKKQKVWPQPPSRHFEVGDSNFMTSADLKAVRFMVAFQHMNSKA